MKLYSPKINYIKNALETHTLQKKKLKNHKKNELRKKTNNYNQKQKIRR